MTGEETKFIPGDLVEFVKDDLGITFFALVMDVIPAIRVEHRRGSLPEECLLLRANFPFGSHVSDDGWFYANELKLVQRRKV